MVKVCDVFSRFTLSGLQNINFYISLNLEELF